MLGSCWAPSLPALTAGARVAPLVAGPLAQPVGMTPLAHTRRAGQHCRMSTDPHSPVQQLRLVVEVEDLAAALEFYRDALGLPVELDLEGVAGERVVILGAGRATLELSNPAQVAMIDDVEVGRRVAPRVRVAFEVDDATTTSRRLVDAGAELVAEPTRTPWASLNSRLEAPADLQITVFQELDPSLDNGNALEH